MRTLKQEINDLERYALSYTEIFRMCHGNIPGLSVKFVQNEGATWNSNIWGKANALVVLLETPAGAHWVTVRKGKWFFDSLALSRKFYTSTFPNFFEFVKDLEWNFKKFQPHIKHSATCGDWSLVRLIKWDHSNKDFRKFMSGLGIKLEHVVALICYLNTRKLKIPKIQTGN